MSAHLGKITRRNTATPSPRRWSPGTRAWPRRTRTRSGTRTRPAYTPPPCPPGRAVKMVSGFHIAGYKVALTFLQAFEGLLFEFICFMLMFLRTRIWWRDKRRIWWRPGTVGCAMPIVFILHMVVYTYPAPKRPTLSKPYLIFHSIRIELHRVGRFIVDWYLYSILSNYLTAISPDVDDDLEEVSDLWPVLCSIASER